MFFFCKNLHILGSQLSDYSVRLRNKEQLIYGVGEQCVNQQRRYISSALTVLQPKRTTSLYIEAVLFWFIKQV